MQVGMRLTWIIFRMAAITLVVLPWPVPLLGQGSPTSEEAPPYEGPFYYRPNTPRPPISTHINRYVMDGLEGQDVRLQTPLFNLSMETPFNWARQSKRGTSLSYYFLGDRQVSLSLSMYGNEEFLPKVSPATVNGYLEGMKRQFKNRYRAINDDGKYQPGGNFAYILNGPPLIAIYELSDKEGKNWRRYYDLFFMSREILFLATLSGPAQLGQLAYAYRDFEGLISSLSYEDEEE